MFSLDKTGLGGYVYANLLDLFQDMIAAVVDRAI